MHLCISSKFLKSKLACVNHRIPNVANPLGHAFGHGQLDLYHPDTCGVHMAHWHFHKSNHRPRSLLKHSSLSQGAPRISRFGGHWKVSLTPGLQPPNRISERNSFWISVLEHTVSN